MYKTAQSKCINDHYVCQFFSILSRFGKEKKKTIKL